MRILLVEDEVKIADFIRKGLSEQGYAVDVACDGEQALFALAATAITMSSRFASAGGSDSAPVAQSCDVQDEADDAAEDAGAGTDTDNIEEECGDQEEVQAAGQVDDGKELLPQAGITLDQAIAAAQSAAFGSVGEVDLEHYQGKLVFNVDIGDKDVKVDASNGSVITADASD